MYVIEPQEGRRKVVCSLKILHAVHIASKVLIKYWSALIYLGLDKAKQGCCSQIKDIN